MSVLSRDIMGDRQRNFAQYATALNQYANFNNDGERSSRERGDGGPGSGPGGSSNSGAGSSSGSGGASHGGTASAGNAALWGELSRTLQYNNYPGFGTAWQGGGGDMRLYGYGGYGEGQVDGRGEGRPEGRSEGRRVPSKGETKATPPLPPGMGASMGSALASLQQLVASGGADAANVYRSFLAARQYAAAAAALSALPAAPPPSINPAALHAASALSGHHQQQQQHQQQQRRQQQQHHQQQLQQQQQAAAFVAAATAGLNGEGLGMHGASRMQQPSPQGRKCTPVPADIRHDDPLPSPGRTRSHPPPTINNQETVCTPVIGKGSFEPPPGVGDGGGDMGSDGRRVQSGSESEGDQRIRHRRKQEQPRRQSVIYPVAMQSESGGGGDSSSDDSQGYDVLLTRNAVEHRDSPHDSVHSNSPVDPALRLSRETFPAQGMSQAMSHALAHPFLAAHLNASQLLQVAQTTPPPTKQDVPPAPSPHSQTHQLQVRTDLLEPHPKEAETSYPSQDPPPRSLTQPQISLPEVDIRSVRTPPSNASLDSNVAPVKKRRCSPSYMENDTVVSDSMVGKTSVSEVSSRSDGGGSNSLSSTSYNQTREESTAHTISPNVESTPVNGLSGSCEAVEKNASSSGSDSQSSLNVSMQSCETEKALNRSLDKSDQDFYNGDNEMLYSPRKRNRKRKSESEAVVEVETTVIEGQLDESAESKRRTRQKRAISYVEDGTDPVLEMNEDSSPDATPVKKKGRRPKEVRERTDSESNPSPEQPQMTEAPTSPPVLPPPPLPPPQPSSGPQEESPPKSMHNSPPSRGRGRGLYRGAPRGRGRLPMTADSHEFSSITEPLHVDTSLAMEPDLRVPGPPPITPSSCSPDVYDFNDTDSDGVGRGKKGKRGRKKGFSPKKNNKQSPVEAAKANISPRSRDTMVKSPKSPKFFSSSRSPVSDRNKEWLRGVSPPVRDLSKSLSEVSCNEGGTYNHAPSLDGKSSDVLQNSESCDSLTTDNAKLDVNVTSPRRSTRRVKPREMDSSLLDVKGDDSSDVSLQSLPSNSKLNTSFSGSILNNAQNSEEKIEKDESPSRGSDVADGSPSSRVRRRGRRPLDQSDMMAGQALNSEIDNVSTPEKSLPTSVDSAITDDGHTKVSDSISVDEKCNSVPPVKKGRRGRPRKGIKVESPGAAAKGKGKGRGKKRKRKFTPFPKGTKKKLFVGGNETNELPEETSQYQSVPEDDVYDDAEDSAENDIQEVSSCDVESTSEEKTGALHLTNDALKPEGSLLQTKPNKVTDVSSLSNEKSSSSCDVPQNEMVLKSSDTPESVGETLTVIAQMEEAESRVKRLRGRRTSAKQDGKAESELMKPKEEELDTNEVIKGSKHEPDVEECIPKEKPSIQTASVEVNESVPDKQENKETRQSPTLKTLVDSKSVTPNKSAISGIQDKCKVDGMSLPYLRRKGPDFEKESFGSQFKAFVENDKSLETQEYTNNEFPEHKDMQNSRRDHSSSSGTGSDAAEGITVPVAAEVKNFGDQVPSESQIIGAKPVEIQKAVVRQVEAEVKVHCSQSEKSEIDSKENLKGTSVEQDTKADCEEKPTLQDLGSMSGEKKPDTENSLVPISSNSQPVIKEDDTSKNSVPGIPSDMLLDVPEASANIPLPPPDAMEVPQGTDMDVDAETVENIAKFLEETASTIPGATEENYNEKRPKRSSRPPRNMDDNEMNDLLMLLNMEDEESEDEDYVPKDLENLDSTAESDDGVDSDGNDDDDDDDESGADYESEGRGGSTLSNFLELAGDAGGDNDKVPSSFKHGKGSAAKSKGLKNGKGKKYKNDTSSAKKGKVKGKVKYNSKGRHDDDVKRKGDDGKKKGEGERKGPYIRVDPSTSGEVIVNTPYRDEEEQDKQVRKLNIQFYCKIEAKQKTAKVGYNSTLHNNYDAFSKDTTWFCSFCKNYSHTWKLGDLFGPYFIEGLTLRKKKYPKVIEGQVVESTSPNEVGRFKKRPPRRESTSDVPGESKKLELGGCSPPWRFVPAATPARMLCRPGSKEVGPQQIQDTSNPISTSNTKEGSTGDPITPVTAPAEARPPGTECWVHESCLLWSPGVHIINSKLCGLEEAVIHAQDSVCTNCSEAGATIGCLGKGCPLMVHVPCATQLHWTLDRQTFMSFCPKHSVSSPKDQSELSSVP
ncbi:serine-rich adhesin for platelets-like isoform X1 [Macrobrachium rosenbergii]|uniref:serine-rich adhesin for platelets-like isoform X1 n=2 Tax=Macrobrachium rosenbergii TaxID=79674 RepID=UPI0034D77A29